MDYIVFDLEWNQCPYGKEKENKKLPFEIIEIGAVKLNDHREVVDEFHQVIRPVVYHQLHFKTREILSIREEELKKGIPFQIGIQKFLNWCGEDFRFCTWGTLDLMELQRNMKFYKQLSLLKGPIYYFDIQKLFSIEYEDRKTRRSLEDAIDHLHIEKDCGFHRALNDAHYTAEVLRKMSLETVLSNYSIDHYQNPKNRRQEIYAIYKDYSKYISKEFNSKEDAMKDREVVTTRCFLCGENAKKKIRWFSSGTKSHFCLAKCPEHGYLKGKIRMKKTEDGKIYVVKTIRLIGEEDVQNIRDKKESVKKKRREKRK